MLKKLTQLLAEIDVVHNKLILLTGALASGKTRLLRAYAAQNGTTPLNLGGGLSHRLVALQLKGRHLQASSLLRELADEYTQNDLLLIDNIELLFDKTLQIDPLDVLKRLGHSRRVVAVWPAAINNGRLNYAELGHPEHRDYSLNGLVTIEI